MSAHNVVIELEGKRVNLSNLDKVLYPETGFTKAQVIDYYTRIAPVLLPHLHNHPLTLKRYPDGVEGPFFFEKNSPSHRPEWVQVAPLWSRSNKATINYTLANDLPTLVWVANLASIELHPNLALASDYNCPCWLVFDLDPGAPADIVDCARVGLVLHKLFDQLGLQSFAKTSGSKGMQIYVPLNTPVTYDQTKPFAHSVAQLLERQRDLGVVSSMKKDLRPGKVLVDWSQNDEHKTTISVYSLRARAHPTVSTPVTWDEVEAGAQGKRESLVFEAATVLDRVQRLGDLFAPLLTLKQELPALKL
jgi:bifunctional non-homologous end joining protein LigD